MWFFSSFGRNITISHYILQKCCPFSGYLYVTESPWHKAGTNSVGTKQTLTSIEEGRGTLWRLMLGLTWTCEYFSAEWRVLQLRPTSLGAEPLTAPNILSGDVSDNACQSHGSSQRVQHRAGRLENDLPPATVRFANIIAIKSARSILYGSWYIPLMLQ